MVLTDSLGGEVRLPGPARRIVSLAPSSTEILFAIGAGDRLIGRDAFSDYPPEALQVRNVGSTRPRVNAEAIVALQPELVLASRLTNPDDIQSLRGLGLAVFTTSAVACLKDVYKDISSLGQLAGASSEALEIVTALEARVARVVEKTSRSATRPKVFYELDATDPSKPWTPGRGSFIARLIELAGGRNAGDGSQDKYFQIGLEELVSGDPEVILLGSGTYGGQTPELVRARPGWRGIRAVKAGRLFLLDDNLVSRPGPRVVSGLETLARLIHPELFP
jgi:iron complex transport system substrate-binding protein